ncbi:MAG: SMP-30/gluconolactonase/LRE family protein [Candidatus Hinthialibacter antarcticus]|nr:SMP-30/gluconolactonase/LRE family protein [Candidatus Hinthialibacter antarcticus]
MNLSMKNCIFGLFCLLSVFQNAAAQEPKGIDKPYPMVGSVEYAEKEMDALVPKTSSLEMVAKGFDWSEGPLWVRDGKYLLFCDIPPNRIYRWSEKDGLSVYLTPSGYTGSTPRGGEPGSNGLLLDSLGRLVMCQHGDRRMARMDAPVKSPKASFVTLAGAYKGKKLNSPNDAVYHKNGDLYFTDPPYGLEKNMDDPLKELDFQGVYRLDAKGGLHIVTDEMSRPNGIAFSPDYKTLYVANSDGGNPVWMAFDVDDDGSTGNGRVFFDARWIGRKGGGDGMKVDAKGNVFATGPGGVLVIDSKGKYLGTIKTERATANCAFGDDGKTLYITADEALLRIRLSTTGMGY